MKRPTVITPNALRTWRRSIRDSYAFARDYIAKARVALAKDAGRDGVWAEDAAGHLVTAANCRSDAHEAQRYLRTVTVEKYGNLSPNAARRESARRGTA